MHMADALISPVVGGAMYLASGGIGTLSVKKLEKNLDDYKIPLMGVMGAFVFASQMINFTIPGTGSSGHIGGGLLLAALLGPYGGFLAMASILLIQALMFGDGGLLAYGCNVFNLGFFSCFIAYPLILKPMLEKGVTRRRIYIGAILGAVVSLQLGAFSVVLETVLSGKTELPFSIFVLLMQPIHLAIGLVEGVVTGAVLHFVWKMRPELLGTTGKETKKMGNLKPVLMAMVALMVFTGGVLSWFASGYDDGLEWSISKTLNQATSQGAAAEKELAGEGGIYQFTEEIQSITALLPDYGFKADEASTENSKPSTTTEEDSWPNVSTGTSFSGIVGGILTMILCLAAGIGIKKMQTRKQKEQLEA